jgi:cytochrome c-type biogenesis protein CcmH/NrfG
MPEWLLLALGLVAAAAVALPPLRRRDQDVDDVTDARPDEAARIRHRAALEALRDVEADRRAGSLDDAACAAALAEAEARAAGTRAALEGAAPTAPGSIDPRGRRLAGVAAAVIGVALVAAALVPATGVANATVDTRRERVEALTEALAEDPTDPEILLALADAYLEGTTQRDLVAAVTVLQVLLQVEPAHIGAYERVVGAYIRAGDWANARAALDGYAAVPEADPIEVAFLSGLVARGQGDREAAVEAFDRFLELAPDDPRAEMVRGLRDEARSAP